MSITDTDTTTDTPCRFRLDTKSSSTLTLPSGRKLGYAEYGSPTGTPIIYHHGFPGSRLEAAYLDRAANKVGARIIALDRPGFGWSSPVKERTVLSHAEDVRSLADHLRLKYFGVLGVSGGGPYALACARALPPERLRAVSIICGLGSPDMGYWGMKFPNWAGWMFGQRIAPGLCRWWFSRELAARLDLDDETRLSMMRASYEKDKKSMHPKDYALFGDDDWRRLHLRTSREMFGQGMDGFSQDFKVLNADFGFRIEDIRKDLPVFLWYGRMDGNVPLHHGQMIAARLGVSARLRVEHETHASIFANRHEECLSELVKAVEG